jgi:hypothetical protein
MSIISVPMFAINGAWGRDSSIVPTPSPGRRTWGARGGLGICGLDLLIFLIVLVLAASTSFRFT